MPRLFLFLFWSLVLLLWGAAVVVLGPILMLITVSRKSDQHVHGSQTPAPRV